eukprot:8121897-Pyramimonas_sp.AAC.1
MSRVQKFLAPGHDSTKDPNYHRVWWQRGPPRPVRMDLSEFLADCWPDVHYNIAFNLDFKDPPTSYDLN